MSSSSLSHHPIDGNGSTHVVWGRVERCGLSSSTSSSAAGGQTVPSKAKSGPTPGGVTAKLLKWRINPDSIHFANQSFDSSLSSSQNEGVKGSLPKGSSKISLGEGPVPSPAKAKLSNKDLLHDLFDSATSDSDASGQEQAGAQLRKGPLPSTDDRDLDEVPRDANGELTSIGSIHHDKGECKACIFITSAQGCTNGVNCPFCHLPHAAGKRQNKMRPCKGKRDRYRKLLTRLTRQIENDPNSFNVDKLDLPMSISQNEATKAKLVARMEMMVEEVKARQAAAAAGSASGAGSGAGAGAPMPATAAHGTGGSNTRMGIMSL